MSFGGDYFCFFYFRYLQSLEDSSSKKASIMKKVVSMSLWSSQTRYTFGALRNAQLMPVYFPGWTLRIYIEKPRDDETTIFTPVPERIVNKLVKLGAEIMRVDADRSHIPPMMWRFLVADDMSVDLFIVRDSDCRLQERDAIVVKDWIASQTAFHCIRDHPSHAAYSLLGGLWGGMPRKLHEILPIPWQELMMGMRSDYSQDMAFLNSAIWPKVQNYAFCHDSVSCRKWPNSHPFPVERIGTEHLGQVFDAFGNARDEDIQILLENRPPAECTSQQQQQQHEGVMQLVTEKSAPIVELSRGPSPVAWRHRLTTAFPAADHSSATSVESGGVSITTPPFNVSIYSMRSKRLPIDSTKLFDERRRRRRQRERNINHNEDFAQISKVSKMMTSTGNRSVSALKSPAAVPSIRDETGIGRMDDQVADFGEQEKASNASSSTRSNQSDQNQMSNNTADNRMKRRRRV